MKSQVSEDFGRVTAFINQSKQKSSERTSKADAIAMLALEWGQPIEYVTKLSQPQMELMMGAMNDRRKMWSEFFVELMKSTFGKRKR